MSLNANQTSSPLPPIYKFDFGDYTSLGTTFQKFLQNINLFTLNTFNLLNGGIGFVNMQRIIYSFTLTASTITSFSFVNPLPIAPSGVTLSRIVLSNDVAVAIPGTCSVANWYYDGKNVNILNITGLVSGTQYTISVEVC